ncbi:MAG TPA: hypothetical protein VM166_05030 [Gemmatimonadaceae bacterium]|nr:hypothetical protein [Gemmatimonadaceae bacterium]
MSAPNSVTFHQSNIYPARQINGHASQLSLTFPHPPELDLIGWIRILIGHVFEPLQHGHLRVRTPLAHRTGLRR